MDQNKAWKRPELPYSFVQQFGHIRSCRTAVSNEPYPRKINELTTHIYSRKHIAARNGILLVFTALVGLAVLLYVRGLRTPDMRERHSEFMEHLGLLLESLGLK